MKSAKGKSKKRRVCKSRKTAIDFPEEVLFEILARLPARSVGRFRCISKSWLSLTTSPIFVRAHTEHSRAACQSFAIDQLHFNEGYSLCLASSTPDNITLCKLKLPPEYSKIRASCDGLLCLESQISRQHQHRIFNPLTGCSVNLPIKKDSHPPILAFYFKHSTSEYRLLKLAGAPNETNMLIVGKNVKIPISCRLSAFCYHSYTTELNGSLHWLAWKTKLVRPLYTAPPDVIMTFHKEAEIYGLISLPPPEKLRDLGSSLVVIKGNLGLLVTDNYGIDLWIKEEQWVKTDSIYYVDVALSTNCVIK